MEPSDKFPPYSTIPSSLEPVAPDYSDLVDLFGNLEPEQLRLLQELKARAPEVDTWIASDPQRAALFKDDPNKALAYLLKYLRMDDRDLQVRVADLPPGWNLEVLHVRTTPVGAHLLQAIWGYLNAAEPDRSEFEADPFAVVTKVADSIGATSAERQAVVEALSTVLGIATLLPGSIVELMRNMTIEHSWREKPAGIFLHRE
ncbi:MAG: hypothetical protein H6R24_489 [Proteobacteria bacterium]|nr:hypothetical protein [Pseudomonadota bacterium]